VKVYVVIAGYDYQGWDDPAAVFDTREAAEALAKTLNRYGRPDGLPFGYDNVAILEYTLNERRP
jgi:hypothetical protein